MTEDGKKLYEYASVIIQQMEIIERMSLKEQQKALSVSAYPILLNTVAASRFYSAHKEIPLRLTECRVEETGKQLWKNDWKNDSIGDGVRLSQAQLGEGQKLLEDSMRSSRRFYDAAMESAEWMIQLLVRQWNPQIPDLEIQVEFADDLV